MMLIIFSIFSFSFLDASIFIFFAMMMLHYFDDAAITLMPFSDYADAALRC